MTNKQITIAGVLLVAFAFVEVDKVESWFKGMAPAQQTDQAIDGEVLFDLLLAEAAENIPNTPEINTSNRLLDYWLHLMTAMEGHTTPDLDKRMLEVGKALEDKLNLGEVSRPLNAQGRQTAGEVFASFLPKEQ
jgi:hypothetical protein